MYIKNAIFILICCFGSVELQAFDASPKCYKDLELNFFQPTLVSQALSLYHVDQSIWMPINQYLAEASKKIPALIKAKAEKMDPNPLSPIFIPEVAVNLLDETLFQVFSDVMVTYNSYQDLRINGDDIRAMFDYIKMKQSNKYDGCFMLQNVKK